MPSPIRLSEEIIQMAEEQIRTSHRTIPKQIEYWATIGREIESVMTPMDRAALANGEVEVKLIRKKSEAIDPDVVFADIELARKKGDLSELVVRDSVWYEESKDHPGLVVQVSQDRRILGTFKNGVFVRI